MNSSPDNQTQAPKLIGKIAHYLLVGFIFGVGLYYLLQGIAKFR